MAKQFDLLIFGATGFTGRFVVERLVQTIEHYGLNDSFRWAVAARNVVQLRRYLHEIEQYTGIKFVHKLDIFETDIEREQSLRNVFARSKLVMNCVGPYSLLGEPVIKACLDTDAHYMDLSGEPLFLEQMHLRYDRIARERQLCAVGSCGFDSIPSDIGISYLKQKFPGRLNHAEHYLQLHTDGRKFNYATWRALVEGFKYRNQLRSMREQLFSQYKPFSWPVQLKRRIFRRHDQFGYCIPFPGSDRSVVIRSQMQRYSERGELPAQCEVYFSLNNPIDILKLVAMNYNLQLLSRFEKGEQLLLQYSSLMSFGTFERNVLPDRQALETNRFKFTLIGYGWPNGISTLTSDNMTQTSAVTISGGDLAYIDTAKIAVQTALALLDKLKRNDNVHYGVITPAVAFEPDEIVPRLRNEDIKIEFITKL
ncbi:saccharopine dehydrogenase-like oxidoreductase [Dermatophagoides farinae]|uniref:Saccharopine dehydrogenase NADP binding domain-containing protein n=1 Tax=Dermatophagoides farinae TaxID=6954 RepID=A0A922L0M8_DERFA|nr:hypothetical protein DERF_012794 [Dermatophagoides farinae]